MVLSKFGNMQLEDRVDSAKSRSRRRSTPRSTSRSTPRSTRRSTPRSTSPSTPRSTPSSTPRSTPRSTSRSPSRSTPRSTSRSTSRSTPRSINDDYNVSVDKLENGCYAYVHKETGEYYVRKLSKIKKLERKQIEIMKLLKGKKNIGIQDVYEVKVNNKDCVEILMEPCVGELLSERIEMEKKHCYRVAAKLTEIIVKVIMTCHSNGVTLGNLKKTFIFAKKHDDSSLKAMYFGSAEQPAKEIKKEKRRKDIKLAGEILYLLVTGEKKMPADPRRSAEWKNLPEEAKDLIRKMLTDKSVTAKNVLGKIRRSTNQAGADHTRLKTAARNLENIKIGEKRTRVNRQN